MSNHITQRGDSRPDGPRKIWIRIPVAKCDAAQVMRPSTDLPEVFLCRDVVDFRKGINGLSILVEDALGLDPFSEQLFIFCNRNRNMVRILYWERNGFCLWQKRLEKQKFKWPRKHDSEIITLTGQQINWLLDGYDVLKMTPHETLKYSTVL